MPILTASSTFTFGAGAPVVPDTIEIEVIGYPLGTTSTGRGRLVHPTLGTLDYTHVPSSWDNVLADLIVPPVWASVKTLRGSANTLWQGNIRDVTCVERWDSETGELRMRMEMLEMLIAFYTTPPDPASAQVHWFPNYVTTLGFKVALTGLTVGGQGITLDTVASRLNWSRRDVVLTHKILGRV